MRLHRDIQVTIRAALFSIPCNLLMVICGSSLTKALYSTSVTIVQN
jgi:hypothetical protein